MTEKHAESSYYGVIGIQATPMTNHEYVYLPDSIPALDGYKITFNNTTSWMEKDEFERNFSSSFADINESPAVLERSIPKLARLLKVEKDKHDTAKGAASLAQKRIDQLSNTIIPNLMMEQEIESLKVSGLGRVQIQADIRCSVLKENREGLENWLIQNNHGSLISPTVNASTLKATIKELMKGKKPWPVDFVKVEPYFKTSIVKV